MSLRSHELSVCVQEPVVDVFVFLTHDNTEQLINVVNDAVCRSTFELAKIQLYRRHLDSYRA